MSLFAFVELDGHTLPYGEHAWSAWDAVVRRFCDAGAYLVSASELREDDISQMLGDATSAEHVHRGLFLIASSPVALHWQDWQDSFMASRPDERYRRAVALAAALHELARIAQASELRAYFSDVYLDPEEIERQTVPIGSLPDAIMRISEKLDLFDSTQCVEVSLSKHD